MGYYTALPLVGFALGPIPSGFLVQHASWRWAFHILSILAAITTAIGFFYMRETYGPVLLERKQRRGALNGHETNEYTSFRQNWRALWAKWRVALPRPFYLLFTQPLIQALAIFAAYIYGLDYLTVTVFPDVWTKEYHESSGIGSINYVSLAVGFMLASQVFTPLQDKVSFVPSTVLLSR